VAATARRYRLTLSRWGLPTAAPSFVVGAILVVTLVFPVGVFLVVALSPRLLSQGPSWLTLSSFASAIQGGVLAGLVNSIAASSTAAVGALLLGLALAWFTHRSNLLGRGTWTFLIWAVLLAPSYLVALGWEQLLVSHGAFWDLGFRVPWLTSLFFGPVGVVFVYILKGVPFAYLTTSLAMAALGGEFEDAARIHGASRWGAWRVLLPMMAPAVWAALALVFAETISDFGVAYTLAASSKFQLATYTLFGAVDNFPSQFPTAAAVGWTLIAAVGLALFLQSRALRGRVYGALSGRTRQPMRVVLGKRGQLAGLALAGGYFGLALGVPTVGAVVASLLRPSSTGSGVGGITLQYYQGLGQLGQYRGLGEAGTLSSSMAYSADLAVVVATLVALMAVPLALYLTRGRGGMTAKFVDLLLLGTVALPGIVLGAGYIFAYNLPLINEIGIRLYGTTPLLAMAYFAGALPTATRILVGPVAQVDRSPVQAARVHGSSQIGAVVHALVPVVSRSLLWAWILTFTGVLFELPVSQLLYPPGSPTLSVSLTHALALNSYGPGTAMTVAAVAFALVVVGAVLGAYRLLTPRGWRQVGALR
jgi:iron(III) transport system permease protein